MDSLVSDWLDILSDDFPAHKKAISWSMLIFFARERDKRISLKKSELQEIQYHLKTYR